MKNNVSKKNKISNQQITSTAITTETATAPTRPIVKNSSNNEARRKLSSTNTTTTTTITTSITGTSTSAVTAPPLEAVPPSSSSCSFSSTNNANTQNNNNNNTINNNSIASELVDNVGSVVSQLDLSLISTDRTINTDLISKKIDDIKQTKQEQSVVVNVVVAAADDDNDDNDNDDDEFNNKTTSFLKESSSTFNVIKNESNASTKINKTTCKTKRTKTNNNNNNYNNYSSKSNNNNKKNEKKTKKNSTDSSSKSNEIKKFKLNKSIRNINKETTLASDSTTTTTAATTVAADVSARTTKTNRSNSSNLKNRNKRELSIENDAADEYSSSSTNSEDDTKSIVELNSYHSHSHHHNHHHHNYHHQTSKLINNCFHLIKHENLDNSNSKMSKKLLLNGEDIKINLIEDQSNPEKDSESPLSIRKFIDKSKEERVKSKSPSPGYLNPQQDQQQQQHVVHRTRNDSIKQFTDKFRSFSIDLLRSIELAHDMADLRNSNFSAATQSAAVQQLNAATHDPHFHEYNTNYLTPHYKPKYPTKMSNKEIGGSRQITENLGVENEIRTDQYLPSSSTSITGLADLTCNNSNNNNSSSNNNNMIGMGINAINDDIKDKQQIQLKKAALSSHDKSSVFQQQPNRTRSSSYNTKHKSGSSFDKALNNINRISIKSRRAFKQDEQVNNKKEDLYLNDKIKSNPILFDSDKIGLKLSKYFVDDEKLDAENNDQMNEFNNNKSLDDEKYNDDESTTSKPNINDKDQIDFFRTKRTKKSIPDDIHISLLEVFIYLWGLITFFADLISDIILSIEYFNGSKAWLGSMTLMFVIVPNVTLSLFSLSWYIDNYYSTKTTNVPPTLSTTSNQIETKPTDAQTADSMSQNDEPHAPTITTPPLPIPQSSAQQSTPHKSSTSSTCDSITFWITTILFFVFQLDLVWKYIQGFVYTLKGWACRSVYKNFSWEKYYIEKQIKCDTDIGMLRLIDVFMDSGPQVLLQLYVITTQNLNESGSASLVVFTFKDFKTTSLELKQFVSIFSSLFSMGYALAGYHRCLRNQQFIFCLETNKPLPRPMSWLSTIMQFLWYLFLIAPRVLSMAIFASTFRSWFFMIIFTHWLFMYFWILRLKTNYCITSQEVYNAREEIFEKFYDFVCSFIYIFVYFNLKSGQTRLRYLTYYLIFYTENIIFCVSYFVFSKESNFVYKLCMLFIVILGFWIAITFQIVYYLHCHPSHDIRVCVRKKKEFYFIHKKTLRPHSSSFTSSDSDADTCYSPPYELKQDNSMRNNNNKQKNNENFVRTCDETIQTCSNTRAAKRTKFNSERRSKRTTSFKENNDISSTYHYPEVSQLETVVSHDPSISDTSKAVDASTIDTIKIEDNPIFEPKNNSNSNESPIVGNLNIENVKTEQLDVVSNKRFSLPASVTSTTTTTTNNFEFDDQNASLTIEENDLFDSNFKMKKTNLNYLAKSKLAVVKSPTSLFSLSSILSFSSLSSLSQSNLSKAVLPMCLQNIMPSNKLLKSSWLIQNSTSSSNSDASITASTSSSPLQLSTLIENKNDSDNQSKSNGKKRKKSIMLSSISIASSNRINIDSSSSMDTIAPPLVNMKELFILTDDETKTESSINKENKSDCLINANNSKNDLNLSSAASSKIAEKNFRPRETFL